MYGFLFYLLSLVLLLGSLSGASEVQLQPAKVPGDINIDYYVDMGDLTALAQKWLENDCAYPGWCESTDVDYSGSVDFQDFSHIAGLWGDVLDRPYQLDRTVKIFSPKASSAVSNVMMPDGTWLPFSAPSATSGIQEAIDAAYTNGFNVKAFGRRVWPVSETIMIPAAKNFSVDFRGPCINWDGPSNKNMFVVDSAVNCRYVFGTLVYSGTETLLLLKPQNPVDGIIEISGTEIWESTLSKNGPKSGDGIKCDVSIGSITANRFILIQFGGFDRNMVCVGASGIFANNYVYVGHSQGAGTYHLLDSCDYSLGNVWYFNYDGELVDGVKGIRTSATKNLFYIHAISFPQVANQFILDQNASENVIVSRTLEGYTDYATVKNNKLLRAPQRYTSGISAAGSPFIYRNTSLESEITTVEGGTVSRIKISADGSTFFNSGRTNGNFHLQPGMAIEITYSVAPNIRKYR